MNRIKIPSFARIALLFSLSALILISCAGEVQEPKHKNKGKNVIYLKIDDQEFLVKEGFSLDRKTIKSEIGGVDSKGEPTFNEGEYFGKKTCILDFNFAALKSHDFINIGAWKLGYYCVDQSIEGLFNSIYLEFKSNKHGRKILILEKGYGWPGDYAPQINILKHDEKGHTISGTVTTQYRDFNDSTLTGDFYMYFDLAY